MVKFLAQGNNGGPLIGLEPTTSSLRVRGATHCATLPLGIWMDVRTDESKHNNICMYVCTNGRTDAYRQKYVCTNGRTETNEHCNNVCTNGLKNDQSHIQTVHV